MPHSEQVLDRGTDAVSEPDTACDPTATGLLALLAAITMLFAAFSSAYIVRRGISNDWTPLPSALLWISVLLLLAGSAVVEWSRKRGARSGIYIAIAFGVIAGLTVVQSWRALVHGGVYASSSPAAAFFFIFGAAFLLCLLGGIAAMLGAAAHGSTMKCSALYWHYVTALWIWVVMLLKLWP